MESNTINDPSSKLNKYVTESVKGFFKYFLSQISDVCIIQLKCNNTSYSLKIFNLKGEYCPSDEKSLLQEWLR